MAGRPDIHARRKHAPSARARCGASGARGERVFLSSGVRSTSPPGKGRGIRARVARRTDRISVVCRPVARSAKVNSPPTHPIVGARSPLLALVRQERNSSRRITTMKGSEVVAIAVTSATIYHWPGVWSRYLQVWTRFNHARTVACVLFQGPLEPQLRRRTPHPWPAAFHHAGFGVRS